MGHLVGGFGVAGVGGPGALTALWLTVGPLFSSSQAQRSKEIPLGHSACRNGNFCRSSGNTGIAWERPWHRRVGRDSAAICQRADQQVNVRKLILTTASVLALGIGGASMGQAAGTGGMAPNTGSNMPAMSGSASYFKTPVKLSKDEIWQAQQQLQSQGLYHGRIDGILGRETKQALGQFQKKNGLSQTARLDQPTMDKLLGNTGTGQGSSTPPTVYHGTAPTTNPQPASPSGSGSGLGDHNVPKQ